MIKIKSLFQRNYDGDRLVRNEVVPGSEWVIKGEGIATRKWDGKAVRILNGVVYVRYDAKTGRTPPVGFEPAQAAPDPETGHWPGWVKETGKNLLKIEEIIGDGVPDGTYEYCGPTVGTRHGPNPENLKDHILIPHGVDVIEFHRDYEGIKKILSMGLIEGVVWWHPDGRMVKIKASDFGFTRWKKAVI